MTDKLDYGGAVRLFLYKQQALAWAKGRQKRFVDDGEEIGAMPLKVWHPKGVIGFRKAIVLGFTGVGLDPFTDDPQFVMEKVMEAWVEWSIKPQVTSRSVIHNLIMDARVHA